jgi:hypothetical protein
MRSVIALASLFAVAGSCKLKEPFVRANPFDPDAIYALEIAAPDSVHVRGAQVRAQLVADPPFPADEYFITWDASLAIDCQGNGDPACTEVPVGLLEGGAGGEFTVNNASAKYLKVTVSARLGDVTVGHEMMVGQKAVTLELSCSPWTLPEDPCATPVARGAIIAVHPRMTDLHGNVVSRAGYASMRATVTSRDPTVVAARPFVFTAGGALQFDAAGAGSTWVLVRIDGVTDSVRVTVAP